MKSVLEGLWAVFVLLVFGVTVVLTYDSDRARRENLSNWIPPARDLQPKFDPPKGTFDPLAAGAVSDVETRRRWKAEQELNQLLARLEQTRTLNASSSDRRKKLLAQVTVDVAPMPREKPGTAP